LLPFAKSIDYSNRETKNRKRKEKVLVKEKNIRKRFTPATCDNRCDNPPESEKNWCYRSYLQYIIW